MRKGKSMRAYVTRVAAATAIALVVGACQGSAAPSPSPTAGPTPTAAATATPAPTATPIDVAKAFVAKLSVPNLTTAMSVEGEMELGALAATFSGEMRSAGDESWSEMAFTIGGTTQVTRDVTVAGERFKWNGVGPWLPEPLKPENEESLGAFLKALLTVEDLGLTTFEGEKLHRLKPPGTIDPAALGVAPDNAKDVTSAIEFYARPDGTPEYMVVDLDWTQAAGATDMDVTAQMRFKFTQLGGSVEIERPEDVWTVFRSERWGYRVAHPESWTVSETEEADNFEMDGEAFMFVARTPAPRMTLEAYRSDLVAGYKADFGDPQVSKQVPVAGVQGHWLEYGFAGSAQDIHLVDALTVHGGHGWEILSFDIQDAAAENRTFMEQVLATFAFTG
jgi:hypothetical protein